MGDNTVNRILRSLCANTLEEEDAALENFTHTNFETLKLETPADQLLQLIRYDYTVLGGPPKTQTLKEQANNKGEIELAFLVEEINTEQQEWGANYTALIEQFQEDRGTRELKAIMQEVAQIATDGIERRNQETQRGFKSAVQHLIQKTISLQQAVDSTHRPLANSDAVQLLHQEYIHRRDQPTLAYGMGTSLLQIDEATKGGQTGELWTVAGFIGHGKSTMMINWARYLAVEGGFNVFFVSLEMSKTQVWRILGTAHSANPKWGGRNPLEYEKVKSGTLTREDATWYLNEVLPDIESPDYGRIEVFTPAGTTTMYDIRARAEVINRSHPLDMIIVDYIGLLGTERGQRISKGERINENLVLAKQIAQQFDQGNGILVATSHQVNRKGVKAAQEAGGVYEIESLADANEAERSSDVVLAIYQDIPLRQKREAMITMLKNRDGRVIEPFSIYAPSEYRFMADLVTGDTGPSMDLILEA